METATQPMILANELRMGNYLFDPDPIDSGIFIVTPGDMQDIWNGVNYEPIPLTPILEKCGLELYKEVKETQLELIDEQIDGQILYYLQDREQWYNFPSCGMKYLHQLQNLYFALTGTELEINL